MLTLILPVRKCCPQFPKQGTRLLGAVAAVALLAVGALAQDSASLNQHTLPNFIDGATACQPLSDAAKAKIVVYLSKRLDVPEIENLKIVDETEVPGTCYRELSIKGNTLAPLSFFVSPDRRFLSRAVFDLNVDPMGERRREQDQINKALTDDSPSRGSATSAVTIVEFGDFECSFCRQFNEWVRILGANSDVRVAFKHLPVVGHPWARDAAALSICAEIQSNDAFWLLHDFFFDNQAILTVTNLQDHVLEYIKHVPTIDIRQLLECTRNHQADSHIDRDLGLARLFHVNATPTVFVNGARVVPQSADELRAFVEKASALKHSKDGGQQRQSL